MPAVSSVSKTGNANVDGVLTGLKWGVTSLTFSFPTSASFYGTGYGSNEQLSGFQAFNATQQAAVRKTLDNYASVSNLTFTEMTESATAHADLRYAESSLPSTAWAYYPSTNAAGGDAWFGSKSGYYDNPIAGNYAYLTVLHETGHALGLKHGHEVFGSFNALPADRDSLEYTVMSYRAYIGASTTTGYTAGSTSYPQTLMMLDIAAIQEMYGANYTFNSSDTVYRWSATTGEMTINGVAKGAPAGNKIFMTVWDGGGNDTYDFSNYTTALKVNLSPGGWTTASTTQLADLNAAFAPGTKMAAGNIANALLYKDNPASLIENAIGGTGNDSFVGNIADNKFTGGKGNDTLDGGNGTDTAIYSGTSTNYSIVKNSNGSWTITDLRSGSPDGTDTLTNIELAQFTNTTITLGTTVTVDPPPPTTGNRAPVAVDDVASTKEDTAVNINVLGNDTDADGNVLTISGLPTATRGTVSVNSDGTLRYTPQANYNGKDTITYSITDGILTDVGAVTVTITAVNDAPTAVNDAYSVATNGRLSVTGKGVLTNDSDVDSSSFTASLVSGPAHGRLTISSNGQFTYTPDRNYTGIDTFTYRDSDGSATSATATVTITVGAASGRIATAGGNDASTSGLHIEQDQIPAGITATGFSFGKFNDTPATVADISDLAEHRFDYRTFLDNTHWRGGGGFEPPPVPDHAPWADHWHKDFALT